MHTPSVVVRTILAVVGVLALAGCGSQEISGTAAPASPVAADNAKPTISESDAKAAYVRLQNLRIACTLVTASEIRTVGINDDDDFKGSDECVYTMHDNAKANARIKLGVFTNTQFETIMRNATRSAPAEVRVIDGVSVQYLKSPLGCFGAAQRNDGVFVGIDVENRTSTTNCEVVPKLTAQAMSRIPASF